MKKSLVLLASFLLAGSASADIIITLKDGSTVQGAFKPTPDGYVVTKADGTEQLVPSSQVQSLKPVSGSPTAAKGDAGLESLRRATANLDDVSVIIKRYQTFLAQNANSPTAKDAQTDLAMWQDRADKKMVKAGGAWVTPDEFDKLKTGAGEAAGRVVPLIAGGKLQEAGTEVNRALAVAPGNADLQYLKGIILYKQGQYGPSRAAFQAAGQAAPNHGPTHNNAGVALAKVRDPMPALAEFEKAMISLPNNQTILDNVAEALHALPVANQTKELTKKVAELFTQQDAVLQRQMATQGKFRWGSQWLDQAGYAVVQARKKEQQDKLDAIKKNYDDDKARIAADERRINDDGVIMQQILQSNVGTNPQGQQVQLPPPPSYYTVQRDQLALQTERDAKVKELRQLEVQYQQQQQQVVSETYKGILTIFEPDARPSAPPPSAEPVVAVTPPAATPGAGTSMTPGTPPTMNPGAPATVPPKPNTPPKPKGPGDY